MQSLLDFFIYKKHWIVFILLEAVSLVGLFSYNGYHKSVYLTTANGVVGSVYTAVSSVTSYLDLQNINTQLEADNEALRLRVIELERELHVAQADSVRLRWMPRKYTLVGAQVVNSTLHRACNLITIDKGEADGIRPEMGVVCSNGAVGIVYLTSAHYSIVIPLLSTQSKVSCRLRNSEYFGTLVWKQGRTDITYCTGIPRHANFREHEIVETNGYSDIFPPGIPIGYVMKKMDSDEGMFYKLKIGLFANFSTLRDVSVITNYTKKERADLEAKADSLSEYQ